MCGYVSTEIMYRSTWYLSNYVRDLCVGYPGVIRLEYTSLLTMTMSVRVIPLIQLNLTTTVVAAVLCISSNMAVIVRHC